MSGGQINMLVQFFKTLADVNRLRIIGLLTDNELRVAALADLLGLSEPTVSHHLKVLRKMGLVNVRTEGTSHYYFLSTDMVQRLQHQVDQLENLNVEVKRPQRDDTAWIDTLDVDEYSKKVLRDYTEGGRLRQLPSKQKKLLSVLDWVATRFEMDRHYTEAEVNAVLKEVHDDYVTLRRDLVDFGYMRRERGGGRYWMAPVDAES